MLADSRFGATTDRTMEIASVGPLPAEVLQSALAEGETLAIGPQTGALQNGAQPQAVALPEHMADDKADANAPYVADGVADFELPSSQLVPMAIVGLQVEPAWTQPAPLPEPWMAHVADERPHHQVRDEERHPQREDDEPAEEPGDAAGTEASSAPDEEIEPDDQWAGLARALHALLRTSAPPPALLAAVEQWQRGRCIVLACPQRGGSAFAYALVLRARTMQPVSLTGEWVEARLQWSVPADRLRWSHARMVKEHRPDRGRQLVPADTGRDTPCAVQLGPVLAGMPRRREVLLRIDSVRRFWGALGTQWSVHLVVCPLPLLTSRPGGPS